MGDRTNPIKFGPEWLRNLAKEPSSPGTSSTTSREGIVISKNPLSPGGGGGASGSSVGGAGASASGDYGSPPGITSKILLAKLRYGREELLALYDRDTAEPPEQLKVIDLLYQPRGKPPYALNNTFEDEPNETPRSAVGNMASGDRYSSPRGRGLSVDSRGRALSAGDNRLNRGRGFPRTTSLGRGGWHPSNQRNSYSGMPDDDPNQPSRSWNSNSGNNSGTRTGNEQSEWNRNKRQSTNWRQQHNNREGWEEWRSSNSSWGQDKQRGQEKWEWDPYSKDKSWNNNRRTWVGGDNNEDTLPEWAVENAEACGGTFDSSGAFHGYSNDDSNLPKNQESPYPLTRSHTHGAFARSKTADEESDEWGATDKAKKVVAKRTPRVALDFNESQYRRRFPKDSQNTKPTLNLGSSPNSAGVHKEDSDNASPSADPKVGSNIPEQDKDGRDKQDNAQSPETDQSKDQKQDKKPFPSKYQEKPFENKRSDSHNDESQDEKGNFKSVMIPSNNILRQKHQNIGTPTNETPTRQPHTPNFFEMLDSEEDNEKDSETNKLVEDILEMNLEDELPASMTNASGLPMRMNNSHMMKAMGSQKGGQSPNVPSTIQSGMPSSMMQPIGITNNMLNATLGLPLGPGPSLGHPMQGMPQPMPNTGLPNPGMMPGSLQGLGGGNMQPITRHPGGLPSSGSGIQGNIQNSMQGMPGSLQSGMQGALQAGMPGGPLQSGMPGPLQGGMPGSLQGGMPGQMQSGMPGPMQSGMPGQLQGGMPGQLQSGMPGPLQSGMPGPLQNGMPGQLQSSMQGGMQVQGLQSGIQNNGMPQQHNHNIQSGGGPSFQSSAGNLPGISTSNVGNNSLFLNQGPGTPGMPNSNEINQPTMFAMHGLQQSPSQNAFNSSIYNNMMSNPSSNPMPQIPNMSSFLSLSDQWYYEDPENIIQGPFSSKEMYNWSQAGFFMATLMVRRACDNGMRPLGAYGMTPFSLIDRLPPLGFERRPQENINPQPGLGLDVMNHMVHNNMSNNLLIVPNIHTVHHNNGGMPNPLQFMPPGPRSPMFGQPPQQMVESLWGQPSQDVMWLQQGINSSRADNMMNNMPLFYWNRPSSAISSNALLPEEIAKEMKTEDQILAQLRAHNPAVPQNLPFIGDESSKKPEDAYDAQLNIGPNLEELQKLISKDNVTTPAGMIEVTDIEQKQEKLAKLEQNAEKQQPKADSKAAKPANKAEAEKTKTKENGSAKAKNKKNKDEKKEDGEVKVKEEETKNEKRSQEPSPTKSKKDEKISKKDMEKEKKEWIKEGFTIVKGADKNKESKKKTDEVKAAEELERKRKEEEKLAAEEDKKRRQQQMETLKRQQEVQHQQQARQAAELNIKKAAWSVVPNQVINPTGREGLNLAEIQRLEREKKLEQMKEQQQMMALMAQQQAATMAREQEIQANLGWAKKKTTSNLPGQSLAEIQAETRKQSAPAAAVREEAQATPPPVCQTPWSSAPLNGGFWDTPPNQAAAVAKPEKAPEPPKPVVEPVKPKKKVTVVPPKKESSPSAEFEAWCTGMLSAWQEANIDVPTFVAFLKDIESPYEVKDYVKCYLGDTKEASEFARQFLERRSRLLRVGMVTPSDDLCSPAIAINPRNNSNSDYQEVKGKGKKAKKNKMLKVDARILGFSVTASEDRINVGDIDTV